MTHRLAIFGDSHYACLKTAFDKGQAELPDQVDLEFWGHVGTRFRMLEFKKDAIIPTDDYTARRFAKFSTRNRRRLPIKDFDTVFFMGCRIPVFWIFAQLTQAKRDGVHISSGLRKRIIKDYLPGKSKHYKIAQSAAALKAARIILMPVSFPTWAPELTKPDIMEHPEAQTITPEERMDIWEDIRLVMMEDGITLLQQPEETVVHGAYSKPEYAVEGYIKKNDTAHRNSDFGALIFPALSELMDVSA
ncbi:MAG: hypothetical protein ACPGUX_01985 [Halocynthiibacter sp.]